MTPLEAGNRPLLATKLFRPAVRPDLVRREHLLRKLRQSAGSKLILVTAPAGFGKTTLVASWLDQQEKPAAWISLDDNDNDRLTFIAYLIGALRSIDNGLCETALSLLNASEPPPVEVILTYLINDMACMDYDCLLVLDDYHVIHNPAVLAATEFMMNHAPDNLQIVIASRHMPNLPLSRLRSHNQIAEFDAYDLRFSHEEAVAFLNGIMQLRLGSEEVSELVQHTEGWITGLQLAALSLKKQLGQRLHFRALRGDDRLIADYLIDEVLSLQPPKMQHFLIQTSILNRFCGPLCDAVLDADDGQQSLEDIEQANLFLIPLDNRREWYRYHHLFGDMLRSRLEQRWPDRVPDLYLAAADWHLEQGLLDEAIDYYIAGRHFEQALRLLGKYARSYRDAGRGSRIIAWCRQLPPDLLRQNTCIWVEYVLCLFFDSHFDSALEFLQTDLADENLSSLFSGDDLSKAQGYRSTLLAAAVLHTLLDVGQVIKLTRQALDLLPDDDQLGRSIAWGHYGSASLMMGELAEAQPALEKSVSLLNQMADESVKWVFSDYLADTLARSGQLREAMHLLEQRYQHALANGLQESDTFSSPLGLMGSIEYEWNNLARAEELIAGSMRIVEKSKSIDRTLFCLTTCLRLHLTLGQWGGFSERIEAAERLAAHFGNPPHVADRIGMLRAWFAIATDDVETAGEWREAFERAQAGAMLGLQHSEWMVVARSYLAEGNPAAAVRVLQRLVQQAREQGWQRSAVLMNCVLACALDQQGEHSEATRVLVHALELAEPEGYIRSFIDEGPHVYRLLKSVPISRQPGERITAYIGMLTAAYEAQERPPRPDALTAAAPSVESVLTPREQEVVQLLAEGDSYADIARRLHITENTLKTHVKHIYSKLGVNNRVQAVLKAEELDEL